MATDEQSDASPVSRRRSAETVFLVRVRSSEAPARPVEIIACLSSRRFAVEAFWIDAGGAWILCERALEAARGLRDAGFDSEPETAVVVRSEQAPAAASSLFQTVGASGITVRWSLGVSSCGEQVLVLSTDDNARAEDALRRFLRVGDLPESRSRP